MKLTVTKHLKCNIVVVIIYHKSRNKLYEIGLAITIFSFVYLKLIHEHNIENNFVHHLNKGKYLERKSNAIFCMITHFSKETMREGGLFVFIDCLDCLLNLNLIIYITVLKIVIKDWADVYYF